MRCAGLKLWNNQSLIAVFTFAPEDQTTTMHRNTPSLTTDSIYTSGTASVTSSNVLSSTVDTTDVSQIFLQTPGAKAIAGVFAFASILVTCIQVSSVCIVMLRFCLEFFSFMFFY